MNPANLQIFFENYRDRSYIPIIKRFSLTVDQIDALMGYFDMIMKEQILLSDIGGSYEQSVFSKLIIKTMNDSYSVIQQQVPFEVTTRYLAAYMEVASLDCNHYLSLAVTDPVKVTAICTNMTFSSLDDVKIFYKPLFFNDPVAR